MVPTFLSDTATRVAALRTYAWAGERVCREVRSANARETFDVRPGVLEVDLGRVTRLSNDRARRSSGHCGRHARTAPWRP
ncbi:hypothetical protein [Streptomyces sp. NPDC088794]|uniref:hypothetical protein n=1 Tax=Streptomyces sp. NPDC088794 TaxID=3365902 RepID=UPI00381E320D